MCNSYNNGHCDYYGVEVRELNYKCERGVCMDDNIIAKLWAERILVQLSEKFTWETKFIPKYKWCPKLCKRMNWGELEIVSTRPHEFGGTTIRINSLNEVKL